MNTVELIIQSPDKSIGVLTRHATKDAAKLELLEYVLANFLFDLDSDIEQVILDHFDSKSSNSYSDALIEHYFKETGERYTITSTQKGTADV